MGCFFGLRNEGIVNLVLVLVFLATVLVQTCTVSQTPRCSDGPFLDFLTCTKKKQGLFSTKTKPKHRKGSFPQSHQYTPLGKNNLWVPQIRGPHIYRKNKVPETRKIEIRISTGNPNAKFRRLRDDFALFVAFPGPSVRKVDSEFAF